MTLALTMALPNGAILMTDGRRAYLDDPTNEHIKTDQATKIHQLTDNLAVATYGLEPLTRLTLEALKLAPTQDWSPLLLLTTLDQLLPDIFRELKPKLSDILNLPEINLLTGFVIAGHDHGLPFISNILYSGEDRVTLNAHHEPGHVLMLGGYSCDAPTILRRHCQNHTFIKEGFSNYGETSPAELEAIKEVMAATIHEVAQHESSVGGTIQFTLLQKHRKPVYQTLAS